MKKVFCDLCRKEITGDINKVAFGYTSGSDYIRNSNMEDIQEGMDFCDKCIDKVAQTVRMLVNPPKLEEPKSDPVPVEKPKKKPGRKPGKHLIEKDSKPRFSASVVWALYDAHWAVSDIARDYHVPVEKVEKILNSERPEMEVAYGTESA